jgi:transposase InsO family protein
MIPKINFSTFDLYYIDRVPYHFEISDDQCAFFRREDGSGALERFGWEDLNAIVGSDRWDCKRRSAKVEQIQRAPDPLVFIWELTEKQRKLLLYRWFFVCALNKLYAQCAVKLTPIDVISNYYPVHVEATKEWRAFCGEFGKQYYSSKDTSLGATPSASSMLKWRRMVNDADGRIDALLDKRGRATGLNIGQESYRFIIDCLREYLLDDRHSGNEIIEKTIKAIKLENVSRKEAGKSPLETRARTALHDWIGNFGAFATDVGRKGKNYAVRKYSGVGFTERATRAGQTFMVDEWEVDARNLILAGPIREGLDQETIDAIKAMPKARRWMYVVMDVATRYVVGFGLSETQNSQAAVRALRSATHDKTDLAEAAGCACEWRGFAFESLESDTGSAFRAEPTQRAVDTACATYVYPQVGQPQFRGIMERVFLTFTHRAMPYIPGQTFRNPQVRGDYNTERRAILTDDQLALIFIRYIVDVYHQTEHGGLFGETPHDALKRLGGTTGLPPRLSQRMRRRSFGIRQERVLTARGIRFLGIDYGGDTEALQIVRKQSGTNKRAFYVDPEDLGTISVWNDGEWLEVGCSVENFHNIWLVDWIEVGKILRSRYSAQAELKTSIIFDALSDMKKRSTDAQKIMGVLPQMYTAEDLDRIDRELYWGLSVVDDGPQPLSDLRQAESGIGYVIGPSGKTSRLSAPKSSPNKTDAPELIPHNQIDRPDLHSETDPQSDGAEARSPSEPAPEPTSSDLSVKPWWHEEDTNE